MRNPDGDINQQGLVKLSTCDQLLWMTSPSAPHTIISLLASYYITVKWTAPRPRPLSQQQDLVRNCSSTVDDFLEQCHIDGSKWPCTVHYFVCAILPLGGIQWDHNLAQFHFQQTNNSLEMTIISPLLNTNIQIIATFGKCLGQSESPWLQSPLLLQCCSHNQYINVMRRKSMVKSVRAWSAEAWAAGRVKFHQWLDSGHW